MAADTPRWATKQTVQFLLWWPFSTLSVRRITSMVARKNKRSRRVTEGLGFAREGTVRDAYPDDDAILYGMTRRWWRRSRWYIETPAPAQAGAAPDNPYRGSTFGQELTEAALILANRPKPTELIHERRSGRSFTPARTGTQRPRR